MAEPMDVIHPEPVWRERADFIISAPLLLEEGRAEQLSAWHEEDHLFEICCIPFFVFDVALGDVVETNARHDIGDGPSRFCPHHGDWSRAPLRTRAGSGSQGRR